MSQVALSALICAIADATAWPSERVCSQAQASIIGVMSVYGNLECTQSKTYSIVPGTSMAPANAVVEAKQPALPAAPILSPWRQLVSFCRKPIPQPTG